MKALEVTIVLDRQEYLPGEDICATVTVANPTSKAVSAFPPFRSMDTALYIQTRNKDGEWDGINSLQSRFSYLPAHAMDGRKTIQIDPGIRLTENVCLGDPGHGGAPIRHHRIGVLPAGEHKLVFWYERYAEAKFRVIEIESQPAVTVVRIPHFEPLRDPTTGIPEGCLGMIAAAFRTSQSTVLVAADPPADGCLRFQTGLSLMNSLGRYTRVAEIKEGVKSLEAVTLGDGSVELSFIDGNGYRHRRVLPRYEITFDASGNRVLSWEDGAGRQRSRVVPVYNAR